MSIPFSRKEFEKSSLPPPGASRGGFTLLEVMLAVVVFSILGVVVLTTFRMGTRAYEEAERQSTLVDKARFFFDSLERDVHAIYILPETAYNNSMRSKINDLQDAIWRAEFEDDWSVLEQRYGWDDGFTDPEELRDDEGNLPEGYVGNPYESGILIDLSLIGEPKGEENSSLSFVTYQPIEPDRPSSVWGLNRVTYESNNGVLVRTQETVKDPVRNLFGELMEEPDPPRQEVLAEGVTQFQIKYGYWFDEVWIESDRWNSTRRELRNSFNVWTPEEDPEIDELYNDPESPEYRKRRQSINQAPEDFLPAYLYLTLQLADIKNPNRTETFHSMIRFHQSQETYVPNESLEPERQDDEIDERINNSKFNGYDNWVDEEDYDW